MAATQPSMIDGMAICKYRPRKIEWSHLYISSVELAKTTRRIVFASLVIKFEILLVFKSHFVFCHEKSMEMVGIPPTFTFAGKNK